MNHFERKGDDTFKLYCKSICWWYKYVFVTISLKGILNMKVSTDLAKWVCDCMWVFSFGRQIAIDKLSNKFKICKKSSSSWCCYFQNNLLANLWAVIYKIKNVQWYNKHSRHKLYSYVIVTIIKKSYNNNVLFSYKVIYCYQMISSWFSWILLFQYITQPAVATPSGKKRKTC